MRRCVPLALDGTVACRGRHAQVPLSHPRRPRHRDRAHPRRQAGAQQADPVHLLPGRLRLGLRLLRHRHAGLRPQPDAPARWSSSSTGPWRASGQKPTNVVFMGMGEPLHNLEQVTRALSIIEHPWGAGLSPRRLTVSTAGVVTGIDLLAQGATLCPTWPSRSTRPPTRSATSSCRSTGAGTSPRCWRRRAVSRSATTAASPSSTCSSRASTTATWTPPACRGCSRGIPSKVNLIPWNPVPGLPFERPSEARVLAFQNLVRRADLPVYIRTPRGDDAAAACGQLAARPGETLGRVLRS